VRGENPGLAAKYQSTFSGLLQPGEVLLTASAAIHVEISELLGRGMGDGTLGVTSLSFLHKYQERPGGLALLRSEIIQISKNWIVLPGSSNLKVLVTRDGRTSEFNFYCGTSYCKDLISLLGV